MQESASRYSVEVDYPPQFYREHAPVWLNTVLTALGFRHPSSARPTWCEVGCGSGVSLIILAASNPSTTFYGIDINPRHVDQARALAEKAGVANVVFRCADICHDQDASEFDYIVAHGIYSWVSPSVRLAIRRFIGRRLKPGGVALLHYLALPGAANFMALHGLFRALHLDRQTATRETISNGVKILDELQARRAGFFVAHPVASGMARQIASDDPDYTAHDYLNDNYAPQAVAEVIHAMRHEGLEFVGSASPMDNLDEFSVPGNLCDLFRAQKSVAMRETIRDLASNQSSRLDLYMRERRSLTSAEHLTALRKLRFRRLPTAPSKGSLTFETCIGKVEGPSEIFSPILERMAAGEDASYSQIESLPAFSGNTGIVNQALHAMMGASLIHPILEDASSPEPARRLNGVLIDRCREGYRIPALAAPLLGSGLPLQPDDLDRLSSGFKLPTDAQRLLH